MGLWEQLNGIKSYLGIIALGIIGVAESQGWLSPQTAELARYVAGTWTGVGVAHKLSKLEKK